MCLRSYSVPTHPPSDVTVIEAILATCASQPAFSPATIGLQQNKREYISPGLGANNPIRQVIEEAHSLFGGESTVASLLSTGNGHLGVIISPLDGGEIGLQKVMRDLVEDCKKTAMEIKQKIGRAGIYFRFCVEQGMQDHHASQVTDHSWIVTQTECYLQDIGDQLDAFVDNNKTPVNVVTLNQLSELCSFLSSSLV